MQEQGHYVHHRFLLYINYRIEQLPGLGGGGTTSSTFAFVSSLSIF